VKTVRLTDNSNEKKNKNTLNIFFSANIFFSHMNPLIRMHDHGFGHPCAIHQIGRNFVFGIETSGDHRRVRLEIHLVVVVALVPCRRFQILATKTGFGDSDPRTL
jgi:hypothetical protein